MIYGEAAAGTGISLITAWMAAIGFTLQIYFDFSGYTDMALGAARLFGIRLPQNFNSPLQSSSIIDFWLRWHMTLTRFLTAYIYNPLVLALTRRRMARGLPGFGGHQTTLGAFVQLLAFPTLLTMFISGLWHGAGYGFVLWGLLHGLYLTIDHAWRLRGPRLWPDRRSYERVMKPLGLVLTFTAVVTSMVLFRSATVAGALDILRGMIGLNGVSVPETVFERFAPLAPLLERIGVVQQSWGGRGFLILAALIPALVFIALACPNTLQLLARFEPALGVRQRPTEPSLAGRLLEWAPSLAWSIGMSAIAIAGILSLGGPSEFLYWQF
jgi:D-alanyl-lipoteichoic acid acyltransferase DltB (MBOAT superfamily)